MEKGLGKSQLPQSSPDGAGRRRNSLILSTKPHTRGHPHSGTRETCARKGPSTFWHPRNVGGPIVRETWVAPSSPKLGVPGTQVGVLTRSQSVISFETRGHRQM